MRFMRILPRFLVLLVGSAIAAGSIAQPMTPEQRKAVLDAISTTISTRAFVPGVDFSKWGEFIGKRQEEIDKSETIPAFTGQVNQALREFGFSHIRLQTPRQAARRTGGGALELFQQTPPTQPEPPKPDEQKPPVRKETLTWVGTDSAVLRVFTFSTGYDRSNIETLMTEAAKAKNLILDLRSNGGGASNNLNHLLSLLLPDKTAYGVFVSRRMTESYVKANPDKPLTPQAIAEWSTFKTRTRVRSIEPFAGKVAVLINRGSASASEIVAAALQELKGAKLVGSKSAGAVLASTFIKLPEGFALQIPVSDYITIKGKRLEANPLVPDAEVTQRPKDGETDPAFAKAIELLGS